MSAAAQRALKTEPHAGRLAALAALEAVIERGVRTFVEVGRALSEIRDGKMYQLAGYSTFESYCLNRWKMCRQTAYDYLKASGAAANVRACVQNQPSLAQARQLAVLNPSQQMELASTIDFSAATVQDVRLRVALYLRGDDPEWIPGPETVPPPFPWFGGKSRAAHLVWERFGEVANYVEPFAGSLAVLLNRPRVEEQAPLAMHARSGDVSRIETVNDLDCLLSNFWRALKHDPDGVAEWADWPVNEADLHARHLWLVSQEQFRERMKTDPDYYDVKLAGWWVWGQCCFIGAGWCSGDGGKGVNRLPHLGDGGKGVNRLPHLGDGGQGVCRPVSAAERLPLVVPGDLTSGSPQKAFLVEYLRSLADRLRGVRVCCGDWSRVLGFSSTTNLGVTGVFLDPPYAGLGSIYATQSEIAGDVCQWAIEHGDDPQMRIALCAYDGAAMPDHWVCVKWRPRKGYQKKVQAIEDRQRERIWFSPHCLKVGPECS